jgi:CheY-like chemotaxis protein
MTSRRRAGWRTGLGLQGEPYTLVLLDAHMPGMDGFSVASEMLEDAALAGATVVPA